MAEFILKDRNGKDRTFNKETIYVQGTDGELKSFTHGAGNPVIHPLSIKENGTYTAPANVDGYNPIVVEVPSEKPVLQDKTITENGEYTADSGFDGLGKVTVEVASSGGSSADVRYVTFMSYDGLVEHGKKAVAVGDDCADPIARGIFTTPTRESDAQYNYTFYGWATTPNGAADANWNKAVTEDKTVYANFASAVRYYTITYYDEDGTTVLKTESLAYGSTPSYEPNKEGFKISGWNPAITAVTGDASYTAQWKALSGLNFLSKATPTENVQYVAVSNDGQNVVTSKGSGTSINYCMRYDTTNEVATESKLTTKSAGYTTSVDINFDGTTVRLVNYSSYGNNYVHDINFSGGSSYASIGGGQQVTCSPSSNLYCYYIYASKKYTLHFSDGTSGPDLPNQIKKMIITKNDKYVLCTVTGSKEVYIVDIATKTIAATVTTNISSFSGLDVSADGTKFVVTGFSGNLPEVYSLETFEKICDFSNVLSGTVYAAFAGDFLLVASGSSVRAFEIVDSAPVENLNIPVYSGGNVSKMQSSSNKKYVAIYDGTNIEVWANI